MLSVINSWGTVHACLYVNKRTYDFMTKREIKRAEGLATRWCHLLQQSTATIHSGQSGLTVASHVVAVSRIDQEAALIQPHNTTGKAARMWDQPMKRKNAIKTRVVSEFWLTRMQSHSLDLTNSRRAIVFGERPCLSFLGQGETNFEDKPLNRTSFATLFCQTRDGN